MQRPDIAKLVSEAPTPKEAKRVASQLKTREHSDDLAKWDKIKLSVMSFILRVKWNCCDKFKQALLQTEGMTIAEATSCTFWGVGVAPNLAQQTKSSKFLGSNHMGKLQMSLRVEVSQEGILRDNGELTLPPKPSYIQTPEATDTTMFNASPEMSFTTEVTMTLSETPTSPQAAPSQDKEDHANEVIVSTGSSLLTSH